MSNTLEVEVRGRGQRSRSEVEVIGSDDVAKYRPHYSTRSVMSQGSKVKVRGQGHTSIQPFYNYLYPSTFNRFPVIQPVTSKVLHFSTFFAHFGLPWVRSWDNRGNATRLER